MTMEQNHPAPTKMRTLFSISCAVVKANIKLFADEVCEFPLPLVEELAVLFSWPDLLKIEETLNDITVTEKGWKRLYEELATYINNQKKGPTCPHCHEVPDILLSFRDRWLAYSMSNYLLETDFRMNLSSTETSRAFLPYMTFRMAPESQHPDLSYSQLHPLVMKMAEQLKKIGMQVDTLAKLRSRPQMLTALSTNLRVFQLDFMSRDIGYHWLEVIKEMMVKGHLQSLQLTNVGSEDLHWLLLLFIISGQFHCRLCAQHFNVGLALALKKALRTPIHPSCYGDSGKSIDDLLESLQDCLQWSLGDTFEVLHRHARTKSSNPRVLQLQHELAESFSSGQCSEFVRLLKVAKYSGLPADQGTLTTGMATAGTSAAKEGSTWEEDKSAGDDGHSVSAAGEGEESCGEDSHDSAMPSTSRERCDLLDEALDVQSNPSTSKRTAGLRCEKFNNYSRPVSAAQASIRLMEILSCLHMEEGHTTRGIEHLSTSWMTTNSRNEADDSVSFYDGMGCFIPSWTSLSSVSMSTDSRFLLDAELLDACVLREDSEYFLDALLCGIRAGSFQSVVFNTEHNNRQWNALTSFFWKVLGVLSGSDPGAKRTQPMQLLKINSFPAQTTYTTYGAHFYQYNRPHKNMQTSDAEETSTFGGEVNTGPGLQALCLKFVSFSNSGAFNRLARFIQGNRALQHISVHDCFLDEYQLDLFLGALDSGVHPSLGCIELNGSVFEFTDDQWQQLSRILRNSPTLSSLALVRCNVQERHLIHADFVEAVRSHRTERKLTLDISSNRLDDSVWDFMEKTVHPDSSLRELYFKDTSSRPQKGVDTLTRLIRQHASHLPLLDACSWTRQHHESLSTEVIAKLQQLSKTTYIPGSIEEEFWDDVGRLWRQMCPLGDTVLFL